MPGYTIDININAGGSGSGQAASSQGASARPTTITDEQRREAFRQTLHAIRRRLELLVNLPAASLDKVALASTARALSKS